MNKHKKSFKEQINYTFNYVNQQNKRYMSYIKMIKQMNVLFGKKEKKIQKQIFQMLKIMDNFCKSLNYLNFIIIYE